MFAYDESPYADIAYYQTHPGHIAAVSLARGHAAPTGKVRVLELGCGSGFNLIAMALSAPDSEFVGIDLSRVQIENGKALAEKVGAGNVTLHACSIEDFDGGGEAFDYIVAHGLYCWVPPAVREGILELIRKRLAPNGVAYVSYNTNPGWRVRGLMRDSMRFLAGGAVGPQDRVAQARGAMAELVDSFFEEDSQYAKGFRDEWEKLKGEQDYYLLHEYLADYCEPFYFEEFVKQAGAHGLRYLAEARYWTNSHAQPQAVREQLQKVAGDDLVRREQYLDWLAGRYFRQTLLVHEACAGPGDADPHAVMKLSVLGGDDLAEEVGEPLRDAVREKLRTCGPAPVPAERLNAEVLGTAGFLGPSLYVQGWAESYWDLRADAPAMAETVSEFPVACPLVRVQAERGVEVTNRLHRKVSITEEERQVLGQLDGTRAAADCGDRAVLEGLAKKALLAR